MTTILEEIKRRIQVWNEKHAERIEAARQAALQCNATVVLPARLRRARRELLICKGSGRLDAVVTIEWKAGER